jgi:hypothetical protein
MEMMLFIVILIAMLLASTMSKSDPVIPEYWNTHVNKDHDYPPHGATWRVWPNGELDGESFERVLHEYGGSF